MEGFIKTACKEIDVPYSPRLVEEIQWRCGDDLLDDWHIHACLYYVQRFGLTALCTELDDLNIWDLYCDEGIATMLK